jgi:hypothetical protein
LPDPDYRLPKERKRVRLQLADGRELEGDLFLRPAIEGGPPAQEVIELMNESEEFFPLGSGASEVLLVAKSAVRACRYDAPSESSLPPPEITPSTLEALGAWVEVVGTAGARYRGWMEFVLPRPRRRLSDALNRRESQFFKIVGGKEIWCVNRHWVAFVRPIQSTERESP